MARRGGTGAHLEVCACGSYGSRTAAGAVALGDGRLYRFGVFAVGAVRDAFGAVIELTGARGGWRVTDGVLERTTLHVRVGDADDAPWLDANRVHHPRAAGALRDGWACCVPCDSARRRRVTFGGDLLSGTVLVRIGIAVDDGRRLAGVKLGSCQPSRAETAS